MYNIIIDLFMSCNIFIEIFVVPSFCKIKNICKSVIVACVSLMYIIFLFLISMYGTCT